MDKMDKFIIYIMQQRIEMTDELTYLRKKVEIMENMMKLKTEIMTSQPELITAPEEQQPPLTQAPKKKGGRPVGWRKNKPTPSPPA
jgi:hypothetical protein